MTSQQIVERIDLGMAQCCALFDRADALSRVAMELRTEAAAVVADLTKLRNALADNVQMDITHRAMREYLADLRRTG